MRYKTKVEPVQHSQDFFSALIGAVRQLRANEVPPIDGSYLIVTTTPCVDERVLFSPKTKAQRKAMRMANARGQFCGFIPTGVVR